MTESGQENVQGAPTFYQKLDEHGVKHVYYESTGTAHEWQTWRRSLYGFAPLLFRRSSKAIEQRNMCCGRNASLISREDG